METKEILALYDEQERNNSVHPQYERQVAGPVVRHRHFDPQRVSFIIYSELTGDNVDQIIQEQIAWFQNEVQGYALEWKTFGHDQPADLPERLVAHGFDKGEVEALLLIDLQHCPPVYLEPVTADVRRITDVNQIADVIALNVAVYNENFDWLEPELRENIINQPDFTSIYIAYVDEVPACAAWVTFPQNSSFAGLWGGATLPQYRQRGLYTAVVAARAQEAIRRGYRFLTVDASDMSRPILKKRGFQMLTNTTPFTWKSAH